MWRCENEFKYKDHNPIREKRDVPDVRKVEMDPETHPEMVIMMKKIVLKFKGVHLNKLLKCQGKGFKDLPTMNDHMDEKKWTIYPSFAIKRCSDIAQ